VLGPSAPDTGSAEVKVLDTFVSRKLVVKDFVSKEAFYQPSHEELLRWPTLSSYIEQHRRTSPPGMNWSERQSDGA